MKKRKSTNQEKAKRYARILTAALAVLLVVCIVLLLSGCSKVAEDAVTNVQPNHEIVHSTSTVYAEGSYHLFKTESEQEYLNFLENFDETLYEIVDISTSMNAGFNGSGEFYMVTYRSIDSN